MSTRLVDLPADLVLGVDGRSSIWVGGTRIALFVVNGQVRALEDSCARCAASLAEGAVAGGIVHCPACGWQYALATGESVQVPAIRLCTFASRATAGGLAVEWPDGQG